MRRIGQKHHRVFTIEGVKRGLCAFDDKRYMLRDGIHTLAHGHCATRQEQTEEFDESIPESALSTPFSAWDVDDENGDVSGFITLSHADSVREGLRPHISRDEAIAMIGGADLRREIDSLSAIRRAGANDGENSDDDDDVPPQRAHGTIDDGDDSDDDANEIGDLINIVGVAMYSGMTEPY